MDSQAQLALAKRLVDELEAGNNEAANTTIAELSSNPFANSSLFQEVGRLTRELHEALNGFVLDDSMAELVEVDMPDATERLHYVIETTEQAAHQTLSALEQAMPVSERLKNRAEHLNGQWEKFTHRELTVDEFKLLSDELSEFLQQLSLDSQELHGKMNDIMMAQGFQDITGQVIKKVIALVKDVESRLVHLIRLAGNVHTSKDDEQLKKQKMADEHGPAVPGVTKSEVVSGQDDVDDLLSSLGF